MLAVLGRDPIKRRLFPSCSTAPAPRQERENLRFARTRASPGPSGDRRDSATPSPRRAGSTRRPTSSTRDRRGHGFARGTATTTDLRACRGPQGRFARHTTAAAPASASGPPAPYLDPLIASLVARPPETFEVAETGTVLTGVAAAPGKVRAPARLVFDPRGVELAGDVLIATRTDPGWVPLFPSARAVVVERGSVLSHSAIVAREFGIPCVVGLRDALSRIRDGALVEVDGAAGTVTIL